MAEWKKVIVSGSNAELNIVSASGGFSGDGSGITGLTAAAVTTAGALMDSEVTNLAQVKAFDSSDYATAAQGTKADAALPEADVDADIKTLSLPANTTISTFGKSLVDDADATAARTTLDVDQAGTDNSTDVTLTGTPNYITISGQTITRNTIDIGDDTNLAVSDTTGQTGINMTLSGDTVSGVVSGLTTTSDVTFNEITSSAGIRSNHIRVNGGAADNVAISPHNDVDTGIYFPAANSMFLKSATGDAEVQITDNYVVIDANKIELLGNITASGNISSSGEIKASTFVGDGSGLTGIAADSFDFDGLAAVTSLNQSDVFGVSVGGTEKKITYSNLEDDIFGNLGGDVSVAAGGSVSVNSVQANSVALGTDTTGNYVATVADGGTGAGISIGGATGEGQAATVTLDLNDLSAAAVSVANDSIAIIDANDSNGSRKESIADLATAMAGTGITATNGVFSTTSGTVSSSAQIDHDQTTNFDANEHFTQANITTVGTVTSGDVSAILPSGTVSGSAQVTVAASQVTEISNLTAAEGAQLENINSVTISNTQWGYLGASNQSIASGASPTFSTANFTDASNKRLLTDAQETLVDNAIQPNDNATLSDLIVTGDLTVQGDVTELQTTNLNIEDQFILLHSGSATNTSDSGIIFGGSGGTAQQGKAILWDSSYNSNDGRLAVSTTDVASNNTTNFGAGTAGYYVAGVFEGSAANAATAKADHNGNIRIESNEIYIYA